MIDWLTFRLSVEPHDPLANGAVMKLGPAGEVEWTSTARLAVVGSYESSVFVRSLDSRSVEISGNPSKFFQGHNLWGSTDLQMLVDELTKHVCGRAGLVPTGFESLSRVDVTAMVDLGTPDAVRAVLRALGQSATMRHRGKGHAYGEGTVYWGKGSRRWSLKAYNKLEEITSHKGADPTSPVALISAGKLRLELTLRGLQLKDMGLRSAASWDINTAMKTLREFLANLELPDQCPRLDVQELPRHLGPGDVLDSEIEGLGTGTYLFTPYCPPADGGTQADVAPEPVPFDEVYADITNLGAVLGRPDLAEQRVAAMRAEVDRVTTALADVPERPRVAMVNRLASGGAGLRVFGTDDVATTIIEAAGGTQAFDDVSGRQTQVGTEELVARNPDVILVPACCGDDQGPETAQEVIDGLRADPALASVPAVRDGRIVGITFAEVSPGIRNADAVANLARILHPGTPGL